ncbi:uncharacterized protein TRIVIDRAFT_211892 [Trichoderma virens Gv29-8]|uniref:Uncharacterized protein n=1 Tax=Hypocrea virens (strain Gv29-8 / FGSC 10586) TaxID=413071 RepID=G9MIF6_HYPVG|nr:uncharacterized protein TRIVIDRAFT_211892 [Trichoderma virens Gv29-8]EHK25273.1 hypothetical protein TRIVIDRAFT_211892 [Trichoderma virens Gv29-8]
MSLANWQLTGKSKARPASPISTATRTERPKLDAASPQASIFFSFVAWPVFSANQPTESLRPITRAHRKRRANPSFTPFGPFSPMIKCFSHGETKISGRPIPV